MSNIQKTLDSLQPYVIGIRYLEGTVLVDAVFKEGWTIIEEPTIKKVKGDDNMNYYMLYSESPEVGLDELLGYVSKVMKMNQEREKKHELLKLKVNELKEIFKRTPLNKLTTLKFVFPEENLVPSLNDFDLDIDDGPTIEPTHIVETPYVEEPIIEQPQQPMSIHSYLDENGNPIELTEEEREIIEEEARAERNRKRIEMDKNKSKKPTKVELPPKRREALVTTNESYQTDCDCGPNEACSKCMDSKDL